MGLIEQNKSAVIRMFSGSHSDGFTETKCYQKAIKWLTELGKDNGKQYLIFFRFFYYPLGVFERRLYVRNAMLHNFLNKNRNKLIYVYIIVIDNE